MRPSLSWIRVGWPDCLLAGAAGVTDAYVLVRAPSMESQPVSERQIKLCHHGCLQAANRAADVADWNREELVDHQLGSFA